MKTIAVTGRSGTGKSSVTGFLKAWGYPIVDGDQLSREILLPGSPILLQLQSIFGNDIVDGNGELNRRLLADRAFKTAEGTRELNRITHPEIMRRMLLAQNEAKNSGAELFFIDGAVIVGTPFQKLCDEIILVWTPYELSVQRICQRDGIEPAMARRRLDAQMPLEELQAAAKYQLCNDGSLDLLETKLRAILDAILEKVRYGE